MSIDQPIAPVPLEQRRQYLQQVVAWDLQTHTDGRVMQQMDTWVVMAYGKEPQHLLHALLSLLTCGLWLIVWLIAACAGGEKRRTVSVDEWGGIHVQGWDAEVMQGALTYRQG